MNKRRHLAWLAIAASAFLAGCASMSGVSPQASVRATDAIAAQRALQDASVSSAAWPATDWWKIFGDPQLDALMSEALADSPTLNIAAARTRKALAQANVDKSALSPRIDAAAASTRERYSEHGLAPPPLGGSTQTLNELQIALSWEIDFWGRNRSAYEAALGTMRAAEVDAQAARLALSTNIAQAYVQLQRAFLQLDVAEATLKEREHIYALTRDRNAAGLDSRLEVKQAEAALPATRERIAELDELVGLTRNQLAALMGAGPDRGLAIARPTASSHAAMTLPSTVPAELLGRRPDIVAQRWRIEAASKDIASAKAEFYPNVNLLAFVGLQSFGAGNLFTAASRMMGAGPAVTLPIFDGGRLRANLAGKDAEYDIAVAQYNKILVGALNEVADDLSGLDSLGTQIQAQQRARDAAQQAYDLSQQRYKAGVGSYLESLVVRQQLLLAEQRMAALRAQQVDTSVQLIQALGGGFRPEAGDQPVAAATPANN
jgi:NodT family efflux transporter outer membrane factor (OMF) lipoprotein